MNSINKQEVNEKKQRATLQKVLKKCPDLLTPAKAVQWSPVGKNTIYAALKNGEIEHFIYRGGYIFTKDALIDYLVKAASKSGRRFAVRGDKNAK